MSRKNVEIVRAMLDAFNRGDFEASLQFLDEGVEWHDPPDVPGAGVHRGPEEVRRWMARWMGAWESYTSEAELHLRGRATPPRPSYTAEAEELIDAGDQVVVVHYERGRGKGSGAEVEHRSANLFDLRNEKVVRRRPFPGRSEALEAAGLRE